MLLFFLLLVLFLLSLRFCTCNVSIWKTYCIPIGMKLRTSYVVVCNVAFKVLFSEGEMDILTFLDWIFLIVEAWLLVVCMYNLRDWTFVSCLFHHLYGISSKPHISCMVSVFRYGDRECFATQNERVMTITFTYHSIGLCSCVGTWLQRCIYF